MNTTSADIALGIPYNIASYSMLVFMLAAHCDKKPGSYSCEVGDAHIYLNHLDGVEEMVYRNPLERPTINYQTDEFKAVCDYLFNPSRECLNGDVDKYKWCVDVLTKSIENYNHHPAIKFDVAV